MTYDFDKVCKAAWYTPLRNGHWGLPLIFKGDPGAAKTARVRQAAKAAGLACETLIASLREPLDFNGWPVPTERDGRAVIERALELWADNAAAGPGVVFIDEANTCAPATQHALFSVVLDKRVGDIELDPGTRFIGAMNDPDTVDGSYPMTAPLANRFGHLPMEVDPQSWVTYMQGTAAHVAPLNRVDEERRVLEAWPAAMADATGRIVGFINARPSLLHAMPAPNSPQASEAWPSPRTVEMATFAVASATVHGLDAASRLALIGAFVGDAWVIEFVAWEATADLPAVVDLLADPSIWEPSERLDITAAVLAGVQTHLASHAWPASAILAAWAVVKSVMDAGYPDLITGVAEALAWDRTKKSVTLRDLPPEAVECLTALETDRPELRVL